MTFDPRTLQALRNHHLGIAQAIDAVGAVHRVHRDDGGGIDPSAVIGGLTPDTQTESPLVQGLAQRYASLPTEKLTEYAQMLGSSPQGQVARSILNQRRIMPNAIQAQTQASTENAAVTPTERRGGAVPRRDDGGSIAPGMASPWWTRREASQSGRGGYLSGASPGRADAVHTTAPGGAYVLPADVVAGLGEGNSLAGAAAVEAMLRSGPRGIPLPSGRGGMGAPRPPSEPGAMVGQARGGATPSRTPVALSDGEYVISPEDVARFGNGDLKKGHRWFDAFVLRERRKHIKKLVKLPGPAKENE